MGLTSTSTTSGELVIALRGRHSQRRLSQRLGYASNVVGRWESGRSWPAAESFFALARIARVDIDAGMRTFFRQPLHPGSGTPLTERLGVVELLAELVGELAIVTLAQRLNRSRFVVSRWLDGTTALRLPDLLALVEACTFRLLDFLAVFVTPSCLPSVGDEWLRLEASRRAAFRHPWSHAVLRVLELSDYQQLGEHVDSWIADRIGISLDEEKASLEILRKAGQVHFEKGLWRILEAQTVDFRTQKEQGQALRKFWLGVASARLQNEEPGIYAYNVCSLSAADFERLEALHRAFFSDMQRLVAQSTPGERVVLLATQLVALDRA